MAAQALLIAKGKVAIVPSIPRTLDEISSYLSQIDRSEDIILEAENLGRRGFAPVIGLTKLYDGAREELERIRDKISDALQESVEGFKFTMDVVLSQLHSSKRRHVVFFK
ncbi:hypothetical protein A3B18_01015 [Candidatus Giovannonibacteria bacterium RIFCSPLOWO2_01_FULL_46_13]|uniref:Uncharacterized protein n=1 Tax=Candidatus Giovannonibacteria bacterium RIFCSPLOWO2_01_FULL_46_13 TaxID=1798352 RepID=A0A1F5X2X2_9BACT|nr:MAG: hypothetical protein A3B18_01015 [Candidatus Giovannonibacteria bacterium RIFCSPLOWO2_01_FULL_46_13]